ncbi:MAG: hypothetical protein KAX40_07745 [Herpetosiphon sp.]|nr:hypothetical protein [Herpetosiphon sp.]
MPQPSALITRLEAIGQSLAATGRARALLGLGSVGIERDRLDQYSDLDFFVLARDGEKSWFLQNLTWLSAIAPLAFAFQNTVDGYKVLFDDDIFCEWAVFEAQELAQIPFATGMIIWQTDDVDPAIFQPQLSTKPQPASDAWLLGEALANLYVGMGRYQRGEHLSAMRFVQSYAVDHVLQLASRRLVSAAHVLPDQFAYERRFEQQFPQLRAMLASFMQGYEHTPASALAILAFLEHEFTVSPTMARLIRARCNTIS